MTDDPSAGLRALVLSTVLVLSALAAPVGVVGLAAAGNAGNVAAVSSCTTISSSGVYELSGDIVSSGSGSCLNVTASDVVVDGQGHTVRGPGDSQTGPVGINVTADRNVTVRDVNVTEWTQNVHVDSLSGGTITNVTAPRATSERFTDAQEAGIEVNGSEDVRLSDVHASDSNRFGVFVTESSNVTVVDSTLVANDLRNLYVQNVSGGTVRGVNASSATAEDSFGMYLNTSSNLTIEDSTALSNGDTGVLFESVEDSVVRNVTARGNGDYGFEVDQRRGATLVDDESDDNLLVNNTVVDNGWHGIFVTDSSNNTVRNNTVTGHSRVGIGVQTADTASGIGFSAPTTVDNVTVVDNTLDDNDQGILVDGDSRAQYDEVVGSVYDVTLRDNTVTNSQDQGVVLSSSTNVTLRGNEITGSEENLVIEEYERVGPSHSLDHYRHDIDTSNTVDGRPVHYYRNVSDRTLGAATNAGFVGIVDARNVTVRDLALSNNGHGVLAVNTTNTTVRNLTTETQRRGVEFMQTDNSSVVESDIENNARQGVALYYADDNTVRNNSLRQTTGGDSEILLDAGSSNNRVHNNSVRFAPGERGDTGILIRDLGGSRTNDNRVTDNELVGVRLELGSIDRTVVRGNDVRDTDTSGIDDAGIDTRLLNNTVHNTTNAGIESGAGAVVRNNSVTEVREDENGIAASGDDSLVTNNTLRDVSGIAFDVTGSNVTVANNTVDTATSGVVTATFAGDVTVEDNTFRTITGTSDDEAGVSDETEEGSGTAVRDNRFVNNTYALRLRGYGTVANNSVESSDVGIWVDPEAAGSYDVTDNAVTNSGSWAYYNVDEFGSTGWPGSVTNLSLPNATVSFTDREAALVGTTQPACDPSGRVNQGVFLNASNTSRNAWLDLTVHYGDVVGSGVDESSLTLYRLDGSDWTELPTTRDATAETVSTNVSQFGTVGLFANGTATCPAPAVFEVSADSTTSPVVAGDTLDATVTVENTGVQSGTQTVTLSTNSAERDATEVTLLGGESRTLTLSWVTGGDDAGSYTATVDSENDTDTAAVRVDATPTPNLSVTLDSTNGPVTEGDTLEVTGTVENVGTAESDQDLTLWVDGTKVDDDSMWLDPGETDTTTLDWDTTSGDAGTHNVTLSTKNDTESTDVTVQPAGGASPANFSVGVDSTTSPVTEGGTLTVDATVTNDGNAAGTQTVTLSAGGTTYDSTEVTLASQSSTTVTLEWATTAGDAGSYTAAVASENDTAATGVTVQAPSSQTANFSVGIDDTDSPVTEGETLTANATVTNDGSAAGTQTVTLTVGNTVRDSTTVSLGASGTTDVALDWTTAAGDAGSYTATVASENDTAATGVTVQTASDAAPTANFTASTLTPTVGEEVTLDASNSTDPDGTISRYEWDLNGNGTFETEVPTPTLSVTYSSTGDRTVQLRVTDDDGNTDTTTATISVRAGSSGSDDGSSDDGGSDGSGDAGGSDGSNDSGDSGSSGGDDSSDSTGSGDAGGGSTGAPPADGTDDGDGGDTTPSMTVSTAQSGDDGVAVEIRNASPDATATVDLDTTAGDATVTELGVTAAAERETLDLTVQPQSEPSAAPALDTADPVGYVAVEHDADDDAYGAGTFEFEVSPADLPDRATLDDVSMYRYHDGGWDELDTTRDGQTFEATTPGFSVFAIGVSVPEGTDSPTVTETTADPATEPGTATETMQEPVTDEQTMPAETTTGADGPGFGLVVALLAVAVLVARLAAARR